MKLNKIYQVDVLEGLRKLKDNSIDCVVTSPPYWALRDYGIMGQVGLENTPQGYIDKIVSIMAECKRVLKPTGTIWLNIGDSYYSITKRLNGKVQSKERSNWFQAKQKLLIPYRIAIKCQEDLGLILRNDINWVKQLWNFKTKASIGGSMPTGVKDRLNTVSESIFFFTKDPKYYFDLDSIRIPLKKETIKRSQYRSPFKTLCNLKGKNPGDCIMFPLEPSREEHIAMFPKTLPEFCIISGCPKGGIVLDPFMGSGTTALVSKKLGRKFIGFEINPDYIKIANRRLNENEK